MENCAHNTLWCKERWRTASRYLYHRMPSPVPLDRLCSDLAGSGRPMGSTGILRQSHKQPQSRAASNSGLSLSPGPPACGDPVPDKQIPEGFGYLWSLCRLHCGMKLQWACRALMFGILRPFWASCPGCSWSLPILAWGHAGVLCSLGKQSCPLQPATFSSILTPPGHCTVPVQCCCSSRCS